jgi:hypothetical protein
MSGGNGNGGDKGEVQDALAVLADTGFFKQFTDLEENLRTVAKDLKTLGDAATQRIQETESLAVHMLAVEAIALTLLKKYPMDAEEIRATASAITGHPDSPEGNAAVLAVIDDLMRKVNS